jgi:MoxR-like ATPase
MNQPARLLPAFDPSSARDAMRRVVQNLCRVVMGKEEQARLAVTCLAARGHLLLEDFPGVGKTTLAEAVARSCGLSFARIQFTADLLPADILGAQVFRAQTTTFEFRQGPLFHQLVLADELNRAPPRTQSALLEAMAQGQVSMDAVTHSLPVPFGVIATQNPEDLAGTFPLPDSQLDRFLMRLSLGHPSAEVEAAILTERGYAEPVRSLTPVLGPDDVLAIQKLAAKVRVDDSLAQYAVALANATRTHPEIERGASTRAVLALTSAAKAHALWDARDFATPGDLRAVLIPVFGHRMLLKSSAHGRFTRADTGHLLQELLRQVPSPR